MTFALLAASSLADPAGSGALLAAAQWVQGTLLGTMATTVAIIAVAATGMLMLSGRIDMRRGVGVVIGCFILFGASGIAGGIRSVSGDDAQVYAPPAFVPLVEAPLPPSPRPSRAAPYDPYAGAAVPSG